MKVLLNAYDSASPYAGPFPNLAIMQLAAYHKAQGDQVALIGKGLTRQDDMPDPDRVYLSCVFAENGSQALGTRWMYGGAEFIAGGSGIDLHTTLPPEVQAMAPDYSIYDDRGILADAGFHLKNEVQFYVLVNYDTSLEEDLARARHLKELGTNPFIMIYNKRKASRAIRKLQRWCNLRKAFWAMDYDEFVRSKL